MKAIWKFTLEVADKQVVDMPVNAKILSVDNQAGKVTVWAMVDTSAEKEARLFCIVGTGHEVRFSGMAFVGSVQQGPFVWHVFVEPTLMESLSGLL